LAESQLKTAFYVQLELQTARTVLPVVSLVGSSLLLLKALKFALVLAKTELTLQKTLLADARLDLNSTLLKE
jgi:hypothetical protein